MRPRGERYELLVTSIPSDVLRSLLPEEFVKEYEEKAMQELIEKGEVSVRPISFPIYPSRTPSGARVYATLMRVPPLGSYSVFVFYRQ